jgi:hypothetical protein
VLLLLLASVAADDPVDGAGLAGIDLTATGATGDGMVAPNTRFAALVSNHHAKGAAA